jgi:hypothetical protein
MAQATRNVGSELANLAKAQMSLATIKALGGAIAGQFKETAQFIQESAKQFAVLRKSMQEVAALKGSPNSNEFTLEQARKAQAVHLSPAEYRDFQAQFLNYAGSQVGGPNGKLTDKQGEDYAGRVAELMKSQGVNPATGAELAGSLLENAKGPQDVDKLMGRLGTTFNVLQKGRVPLERALPQISQIMGHGIEAEDAAKLFSIVSPASPGQEGTAVESALKAIEEMKNKGTGEEFGVKRGMGQYDSVKAFARNINQRKQKLVAGGKTEQEAQDELNATLADRGVAADVRERRGLVAGFARQGVELGGFDRYEKFAADTPSDFAATKIKEYEGSQQGRDDAIANAHAVEQTALGERNQELMRRRQIAEAELMKAGRFEEFGMNQVRGGISQLVGGEGDRDIQTNRQMLARARAQLGEESGIGDRAASLNNSATDSVMRGLMQRIAESNERMEKLLEKPQEKPKPLVAVPGGGAGSGRMGG